MPTENSSDRRREGYAILLSHPIRFNDTDRQGHVNNASFVTYFEVGRTEFMDIVAPDLIPQDARPILAHLEIDYLAELFFPGLIDIAIAVRDIGGSSTRLAQAVFREGACVAVGTTVLVQIDAKTRRPRRWSDAQRAILSRYALREAR